ncbi:MAG: GatB/YqeY domain-containing protein, partial [Steroidobacteraceae bacterium]
MSLKERIQEDMKAAMRSGAKDRLGCIRLILAAIKQREVDERVTLEDAQLISVLEKMGKQRRESIAQFQAGGRADLVAKENAELSIISSYMPAQMSDAELDALIGTAIAETGAASIKDMGKVMGIIKSKAQG